MKEKWYKVFRAGKYPQGDLGNDVVDNMAGNYDPEYFEAPLTVDHSYNGPALGWVEKVKAKGGELFVTFKDVSEEAIELVRSGKYKRPSIEIMNDEIKGAYLRAVSLVVFPAVRSLPAFEFNDAPHDVTAYCTEDIELTFQETKSKTNMDVKKYAETLGLPEDTSAEDVLVKFAETIEAKDSEISALTSQVETLAAEVKQFNEARVNDFVKSAIDTGKITKSQEDKIQKWAETNFDACKSFVDELPEKDIFKKDVVKTAQAKNGRPDLKYSDILDNPSLKEGLSEDEVESLRKASGLFPN